MSEDPPRIDSRGERPTRFGDEEGSAESSVPSAEVSSLGESPTRIDARLAASQGAKASIPSEFHQEHCATLLRPGDVINERFKVVELLGFGGMGTVYKVQDRWMSQVRALKVMLPSLLGSEAARARFVSEARIAQQLRHEGIVAVYDLDECRSRGVYFFTMEYIEGKTLHDLLGERGGKLRLAQALGIASAICRTLEYAHRFTVHRDLKPQNVMIQQDGVVKLLDFGLAKVMTPGRMTRSSVALGTAYYQAPEQAVTLGDVDQRADIYSLGVILYQMLTGTLPIGRFALPSDVVEELPNSLDPAILTCLEPNPDKRFGSARDLCSTLNAVLAESDMQGSAQESGSSQSVKTVRTHSEEGDLTVGQGSGDRFAKDADGVIADNRTGLEWYVGPDDDTTRDEALAWVGKLSVAGGGWHMPDLGQLETLYEYGASKRNLDWVFETTGFFVWSCEADESGAPYGFGFNSGRGRTLGREFSNFARAFAVRSKPCANWNEQNAGGNHG